MKKIAFLIMTSGVLIFTSCNNTPKGEEAQVTDEQAAAAATGTDYKVNTETSVVKWIGASPIKQHDGTFKLTEGTLTVANNNLTAGSFTIDVNSLNNNDLQGEYKTKLEGHLKSADFFETEKYPNAKFEITSVETVAEGENTHKISGNLTLKDATKNITFPAKVNFTETEVTATANFNIDRSQWNVSYGNDASLGDKLIKPEVNITVDLKAAK
jgi:polyisoprenoid-binding protein YceI